MKGVVRGLTTLGTNMQKQKDGYLLHVWCSVDVSGELRRL